MVPNSTVLIMALVDFHFEDGFEAAQEFHWRGVRHERHRNFFFCSLVTIENVRLTVAVSFLHIFSQTVSLLRLS